MRSILVILLFTGFHIQEPGNRDEVLLETLNGIRLFKLSEVEHLLKVLEDHDQTPFQELVTKVVRWKYSTLSDGVFSEFPSSSTLLIPEEKSIDKAIYSLFYGEYLYEKGAYGAVGYLYYTETKEIGELLGSKLLICEALKRMLDAINRDQEIKIPGIINELSEEYQFNAHDSFEEDLSRLIYWRTKSAIDKEPYLEEFQKGEVLARQNGNELIWAYYLKLLGVKHDVYAVKLEKERLSYNNYQKSLDYSTRAITIYEKYLPAYFAQNQMTGLTLNMAINYHFQTKYKLATEYLQKASGLASENDSYHRHLINHWLAANYDSLGQYDSAYHYQAFEMIELKEITRERADISVAEIYTRFETEKKQRQIETQKATIALNTRIQIISTVLLLIIISLLILRFRATRLAVIKDKKLHSQEINQLIANQELRMIQAAIEAEEKERARMAEDLHDRLGSTLSATRMHMEVLEDEISEVPDDKTAKIKGLLDKAIEDTRQISHNMLSGVLAKFGLRAAIEDLRETVTSVNSMKVQVDYGKMQFALSKDVEVQVFRVIQELMSNTLKHAHADLVNVSFAQQKGSLQLIFEDDGLGFDQNAESNGIGLKNIKSRLHKIKAEYTYQSDERGTKVTITIPT